MAIVYFNPFSAVGSQFSEGLDYIISNLPSEPSFDDLNYTTVDYVGTLISSDSSSSSSSSPLGPISPAILANVVNSIIPDCANEYINMRISENLNFNYAQNDLVQSILQGLETNTIESLGNYWDGVDEQIAESCLSTIDKSAIYIAAAIGRASTNYWTNLISPSSSSSSSGPSGDWSEYLNTNEAINYANIPAYVRISFTTALAGYAKGQSPNMGAAGILNDLGRVLGSPLAIGAALGVTSGKIIFNWSKRPDTCNC